MMGHCVWPGKVCVSGSSRRRSPWSMVTPGASPLTRAKVKLRCWLVDKRRYSEASVDVVGAICVGRSSAPSSQRGMVPGSSVTDALSGGVILLPQGSSEN
jgi:hypothetical protein